MTGRQDATEHILMQADALMRRPRTFVAQPREQVSPPDTDTDLPVLTDVVAEPPDPVLSPRLNPEPLPAELLREIETALAAWLDIELPKAVLRVTDGLADRLIEELEGNARAHLLAALTRRFQETER